MHEIKLIQVRNIDENGQRIGKDSFFLEPTPEPIPENGMSHVKAYVARLIESKASLAALTVCTFDKAIAVGVSRQDGQYEISFFIERVQEPGRELRIQQFFEELKFECCNDYLATNNGQPESTRVLMYIIPSADRVVPTICRTLEDVYNVPEKAGLLFTFIEHTNTT